MKPTSVGRIRDSRGMTLLEVVIAVAILAVIVVAAVASLRVGLRAWEAGERQAAVQQEIRAVTELVTEALAEAYPYRDRLGTNPERVVLFQGEADQVRFVTTAPPLALDAPAAPFHAVTLSHTAEGELRMRERLVPAEEPFGEGPHAILSRSVTALRLEYRDAEGGWQNEWDGTKVAALPAAVRIELTVRHRDRSQTLPRFLVPIPLGQRVP